MNLKRFTIEDVPGDTMGRVLFMYSSLNYSTIVVMPMQNRQRTCGFIFTK